jgi:hypothetical protein
MDREARRARPHGEQLRVTRRLEHIKRGWRYVSGPLAPWLSLAGGVAAAVLWRHGIDHVRAAVVLASLLGSVALLWIFPPWREGPANTWRRRADAAAGWASVNLAQNALSFVLPFYVLSTTWTSMNLLFTLALGAAGVASCFDAFMRDRVLRTPAFAAIFVGVALFAALQLMLPVLTSVAPRYTVLLAGALAGLAATSLLVPLRTAPRRAVMRMLLVAGIGALLARTALPLIPPAPLRLVSATFARGRVGLDPVQPITRLAAGDLVPAYVFVSVEAPRGVVESVRLHVDDGAAHQSRPLGIEGGRAGGYRLWTRVRPALPGLVRATVRTLGGQIVGRVDVDAVASLTAVNP